MILKLDNVQRLQPASALLVFDCQQKSIRHDGEVGRAIVSHDSCSYAHQVTKPSSVVCISVLSERGWHSVVLTGKPHCGLGCEPHSELAATGDTHGLLPAKGS